MKNLLKILFLLSCTTCLKAQVVQPFMQVINNASLDSARFHFSAGAISVSGRTNVSGDPTSGVRSATSGAITVSSVATANWTAYLGVGAFNEAGANSYTFFSPAIDGNSWFCTNTFSSGTHQILISGLNPAKTYTIRMGARQTSGTDAQRLTDYRIQGSASVVAYGSNPVHTLNNTSTGAVFTVVSPDGSGQVKVWLSKGTGSDFGSINGLDVYAEN